MYASYIYRADGERFVGPMESLVRFFRHRRYRLISNGRKPPGRMLDIGCARGLMLSYARKEGWDTYGLEYNSESARNAREVHGLNVRTGSVCDAGFDDDFFDVITIWHVLEHLEAPFQSIRECRRILKPGGLLVISVPNLSSFQARICGKWWFHLDIPFHLYHFSAENLYAYLKDGGFTLDPPRHFCWEQGPYGALQSILNGLTHSRNVLYDALKTRKLKSARTYQTSIAQFLVSLLLLPLVAPAALGLFLVESIAGRGGSVTLMARKENRP